MALEDKRDVPSPTDPSIGELVADASRDVSALVNQQIALAKSELKISLKNGGTGAGLFAGALFIVLLGIVMLSVAFAYLINWNGAGLSLHWAFLIVAGVYFLIGVLLALLGYRKVQKVRAPERAIEQVNLTKAALTHRR